jgi:hypothetical protein
MLNFGLRPRRLRAAIGAILLLLNGSCIFWRPPTEPAQPKLAVCPIGETRSTLGVFGLLGGTLSLSGSSVVVPVGALLEPTSMALTIPAGQYMEIRVTANGGHFLFEKPITMTIDYSRCPAEIRNKTLKVWEIDPISKELLEDMGGIDNKLLNQITITSIHLSGFAIAY